MVGADHFSVDDLGSFASTFHQMAYSRGEAVIIMSKDGLNDYISTNSDLHLDAITRCFDHFTLRRRPKWDEAPDGFEDSAWHPWRFRRPLSVVTRPILELSDSEYAIAPAMIVECLAKFVADARHGYVDEKHFTESGHLARWVSRIGGVEGEGFNEKVAGRIKELGWNARANLSDGEVLNRKKDPRFGDVDVLAWSTEQNRVCVIECKDLSLDKTPGEIARRLANYQRVTDRKGRRDELRKHLDRVDALRSEPTSLSDFAGFDVSEVESILLLSTLSPLRYFEALARYNVRCVPFGQVAELLNKPKNASTG
ncbi:MAG: hypothetical protein AAGF14_09380 [Pseudomonadota bacterium]